MNKRLPRFYDLFYVAVIGSLSSELSAYMSFDGIRNFCIGFIPIWWIWVGSTIYNERFETDGIENRIFSLMLMIPVTGLAVFAHNASGENLRNFLVSYAIARMIIIYLWARAGIYNKNFRPVSNIYILGFSISVILVTIAAILNSEISKILFPIALVIDLHTPFFTIRLQQKLPRFTTSKLPERYGLFTIIVLGEIVVGIISGLSHHAHFVTAHIPLGILGIATALGFWWLYFDFIARRPFHRKVAITIIWSYIHMPLVMSFALIGAGLETLIANYVLVEQQALEIYLMTLGIALILIGLLELTLERNENEPTTPLISVSIKVVSGLVGIATAISGVIHTSVLSMVIGLCLILLNIFYSTYVWFHQKV